MCDGVLFLWVFFFIIVLIGSLFFFFPIEKNLGHFYNNFDNKESSVEKNNKESLVEKNNKEESVEKNATLAKEECINDLRSFWGTEEEIINKKSFKDNIINEIDNKISDIKLWKYKYEWHIQDQKLDTKFQKLCQENEYFKNQINDCKLVILYMVYKYYILKHL